MSMEPADGWATKPAEYWRHGRRRALSGIGFTSAIVGVVILWNASGKARPSR
jgi:hypothetical protein